MTKIEYFRSLFSLWGFGYQFHNKPRIRT